MLAQENEHRFRISCLPHCPASDYQNLLPVLEPVELAFGEALYDPIAPVRHVYFPNDCFVSMLTTVDGGRAAEVGLIGPEGMIGIPVALGIARLAFSGRGTRRRHGNADER